MGALENDLNPDTWIGLSFPLGRSASGFFQQTQTTLEQTSHNIKNLLLTMKGERAGQPLFGSDLPSIIFEPIDGSIGEKIDIAIREALEIWLPYVTAENIVTVQDKSNPNLVTVSIEFRVDVDDPDAIETITFNFNTGG